MTIASYYIINIPNVVLQIWDLSVTHRISLVATRNGNGYFYPTRPVFVRFPSKVSAFACVTRPL